FLILPPPSPTPTPFPYTTLFRSDSVQRFDRLALARSPNDDAIFRQLREIESMQRLPQFVKHIIRYIGDVLDRSLADRFELFHQPLRRGRDLHAANNPRGITRAEVGVANLYGGQVRCFVSCIGDFGLWTLNFGLVDD